jgi:hypothetical protein
LPRGFAIRPRATRIRPAGTLPRTRANSQAYCCAQAPVLPLWLPVPARSSATKRDAADHTRAQQRGGWFGAPAQLASLGAYSVPPCPRSDVVLAHSGILDIATRPSLVLHCVPCLRHAVALLKRCSARLESCWLAFAALSPHTSWPCTLVTLSACALPPCSVKLARLCAPPRSVISRRLSLAGASNRAAVCGSRRYNRCEMIGRSATANAAHRRTVTIGLGTAFAPENYTRVMLGRPRPATAPGVAVELRLDREHNRSAAHERAAGNQHIAARKHDISYLAVRRRDCATPGS